MDVTFNNVLEGTRQYFLGLPKQAQSESSAQSTWSSGAPISEGPSAASGAPTPSPRPPSQTATPAAGPDTPAAAPPRPPSEPLEPEPHIIHKATVMREAAEKRRELPDPDDEEEPADALSPPSHIIRKPPAPASCLSSVPPPSTVATDSSPELLPAPYRQPVHHVQTPPARPPDRFAPGRPPDPYSSSRPPEPYPRYHYETSVVDGGRNSHGPPVASPQPSARHSPQQTYARMSNALPTHSSRLREAATHSPPTPRYQLPPAQPPPHNDRVPPIHHPQPAPPSQRLTPIDARSSQMYPPHSQRRDSSPYGRTTSHYERHPAVPPRKYDPQQAYPGYRPTHPAAPSVQGHRVEHHPVQYKHIGMDAMSEHYATRAMERSPAPLQVMPPSHSHESLRLPPRMEYSNISRTVDARSPYHYPTPSTSAVRYASSATVGPAIQNITQQSRTTYRPTPVSKAGYDYTISNHVQTSPARSTVKPGYANQQSRMTVSVTTLVNQMNQTKQKRESPLDLSVKTVKNSADSSTTQDEVFDSTLMDNKTFSLQPRSSSSSSRHVPQSATPYVASHKVDFAPDFAQYRERSASHNSSHSASYSTTTPPGHPPVRYNGAYEAPRPVTETYPAESRHQLYPDRNKYSVPVSRSDYVPRIDLTRTAGDDRHTENRIRDDRHFVIEERKRPSGNIVTNIPEKIVRYETWSADSRIERMNRSAREQHELMSQPVYSYSNHKRFEAYHADQKKSLPPSVYREHQTHINHRYPYAAESRIETREPSDLHSHYHDRNPSSNNRHVIQKIPSHRDIHSHLEPHGGVPADKRVLSILRNSLETKQTGHIEPVKPVRQIPDLIVIDDVDDSVIEITDLTKENDAEVTAKNAHKPIQNQITSTIGHHIQMPKAVDSIPRDSDYQRLDNADPKSKSPENDVASRIRTKAELKVMPPSQDSSVRSEIKQAIPPENEKPKLIPKSQKQHLFNQIREDNLRLESVIKNDKPPEIIPEIKTEPLNVYEIEKDAELPIKTENILENLEPQVNEMSNNHPEEDLDWANACDNFMEQLKSGCLKKKIRRKPVDTLDHDNEIRLEKSPKLESTLNKDVSLEKCPNEIAPEIIIKQEPVDDDEEIKTQSETVPPRQSEITVNDKAEKGKMEKNKMDKKNEKECDKSIKNKAQVKAKVKLEKTESLSTPATNREEKEKEPIKTNIKEELESTDDDEPLIKSKLLKEKEQSERYKYQLLKELSEKSAYVKLECYDLNKNSRKSIDSNIKDKEEKHNKGKLTRQASKLKGKSTENTKKEMATETKNEKQKDDTSTDSDDDDLSVASRLRMRRSIKSEDHKIVSINKTPVKTSQKKLDSSSTSSTPVRKPGFGDGSDFHPGWEEELYRYKRSLRMPTRLIAIPRGRSGGPFVRGSSALFTRGSTSLPDLDPAPLSPAPSSAPSAATDDLYARRPDKHTLDSDLESNSSCSAVNRLHYDSEASTSTVFSSRVKKNASSIVDVLIQKCGKKEDSKKKSKDKEEKSPKVIAKSTNTTELLATPSLGLVKNGNKGNLSVTKEKLMGDIFYLGAFRKETVTAFRTEFIKNTDGLIGATEEFAPVVLKSRTRTESRVLKQRATIKEVFGDERPASAPPSSCRENDTQEIDEESSLEIKEEPGLKSKIKSKIKDKLKRRSSSIRDGLRSTKSLKRNDAKGRLLRLKKRNNLVKALSNKRMSHNKHKKEKSPSPDDKDKIKEGGSSLVPTVGTKRRLKRLFGRRKLSSGFDYIRKKKKIIRGEKPIKVRRPAPKPSPESVHDIQKEIKSWFINKSIGETHLHRAARLGYTDCVAYCLEKMEADPSAKDNAGYTPLHMAASKGHVRIARLLLQYGANVSAAAQGGIRPLHEASEYCHVEMIRLLLAYGADPLLGTYAGQTPEELAEGSAALLIRLHVADAQGLAVEPWRFPPLGDIIDREELGCDPLSSPPPASPPPPDATLEIQCTEAPLPPFYSLRAAPGQPADGLWCLLQDITNLLQIKSKESLLKQIHCGSGSPKELLREIRTQEFLERAQCHQLLCAGEKVNVRASKVALVRVTDKLRQLLKVETVLVS